MRVSSSCGSAPTKNDHAGRKREVDRAAVESARVDGSLSAEDRGVLATLAQQLELGAKDGHAIHDVRALRAGVT